MRILLDTHSFLWFVNGDDQLSNLAKECIIDPDNDILLSIASLWEITIKLGLGKLSLARPFEVFIPEQLVENNINVLPVNLSHLQVLLSLPLYHRDPFDRMIIAQAHFDRLPLVGKDVAFQKYPIQMLW